MPNRIDSKRAECLSMNYNSKSWLMRLRHKLLCPLILKERGCARLEG